MSILRTLSVRLCTAGFQWCLALCSSAPTTNGTTVALRARGRTQSARDFALPRAVATPRSHPPASQPPPPPPPTHARPCNGTPVLCDLLHNVLVVPKEQAALRHLKVAARQAPGYLLEQRLHHACKLLRLGARGAGAWAAQTWPAPSLCCASRACVSSSTSSSSPKNSTSLWLFVCGQNLSKQQITSSASRGSFSTNCGQRTAGAGCAWRVARALQSDPPPVRALAHLRDAVGELLVVRRQALGFVQRHERAL